MENILKFHEDYEGVQIRRGESVLLQEAASSLRHRIILRQNEVEPKNK